MTTKILYVLFNKGKSFESWSHNLLPKPWVFITTLPIENPKNEETTFDFLINPVRTFFGLQPFIYTYYEEFAGDEETLTDLKVYLQLFFSNLQKQGIIEMFSIREYLRRW